MVSVDRPESVIKVAVADGREQFRKAIKALLSTFSDIEVIAEADSESEAIAVTERYHPEVVLIGDLIPILAGFKTVAHIKNCWPEVSVIVITVHEELMSAAKVVGADSFLVKGGNPDTLVSTIRNVSHAPPQKRISLGG